MKLILLGKNYKLKLSLILLLITSVFIFVIFINTNNYPWYIGKMKVNNAWKISTGNGQTIAFIDTGISKEYYKNCPNRIVSPYNVLKNNEDVTDKIGHGTELITVACGSYKEFGVYGIAPNTKIMPIVVADDAGIVSPENLEKGIIWAITHGANIINLSIGSHVYNKSVENAILLANKKKIIVIASSGDYAQKDLLFPSRMSNVIAIASQEKSGNVSTFSNYSGNKCMLVPGEEIDTMSIDENGNNKKKEVKGTSISCALMSGIIALALEHSPQSSFDTIDKALRKASNNSKSNFINVNDFLKYLE